MSLLAPASASRLPQANSSHCEAMLHAGYILRFTLVCGANQHIASRLLGVSPTIGAAPRNVIGRMDRAARSPASQGGGEGVDLCPQPNPTSDDLPRDCPRAAAPAIARNQERIAQPGAFCRGVREGIRLRQGYAGTRCTCVRDRLSRRNAMKPDHGVMQ